MTIKADLGIGLSHSPFFSELWVMLSHTAPSPTLCLLKSHDCLGSPKNNGLDWNLPGSFLRLTLFCWLRSTTFGQPLIWNQLIGTCVCQFFSKWDKREQLSWVKCTLCIARGELPAKPTWMSRCCPARSGLIPKNVFFCCQDNAGYKRISFG